MNAWQLIEWNKISQIFMLFAIPVGGGIPAGVLLAQKYALGWIPMAVLYFVSDIILAILFEPILRLLAYLAKWSRFLQNIIAVFKLATDKTIARYGSKPGIMLLVGIAFGVDPMTGRAAALAAGHNFISGWAIAIAGDMIFFSMIAVSTIYLNDLLGDGTWTAVIMLVLMFIIPTVLGKIRNWRKIPAK